jgi:hypothetical protein
MGAYIRNIFGDKVRRPQIPPYNHVSNKTMMANIMFRIPKHFNPAEAFNLLCNGANILWYAYKPNFTDQPRARRFIGRSERLLQHGSAEHFVYLFTMACFLSGVLVCASLNHITQIVWLVNSDLTK